MNPRVKEAKPEENILHHLSLLFFGLNNHKAFPPQIRSFLYSFML
jgi:hypothetical protein